MLRALAALALAAPAAAQHAWDGPKHYVQLPPAARGARNGFLAHRRGGRLPIREDHLRLLFDCGPRPGAGRACEESGRGAGTAAEKLGCVRRCALQENCIEARFDGGQCHNCRAAPAGGGPNATTCLQRSSPRRPADAAGPLVAEVKTVARFSRTEAPRYFGVLGTRAGVFLFARTGSYPSSSPGETLAVWRAEGAALADGGYLGQPGSSIAGECAHNFGAWAPDADTILMVCNRNQADLLATTPKRLAAAVASGPREPRDTWTMGTRALIRGCGGEGCGHPGCTDFVKNRCEWDGKFSVARLRGKTLVYGRANTGMGTRSLQVAAAPGPGGPLGAFRPISFAGLGCHASKCNSMYLASINENPVDPGSLVGLFPLNLMHKLKTRNCSLALAISCDGVHFGFPHTLMETRCAPAGRSADLPADGLLVEGEAAHVYLHRDMPMPYTAMSDAFHPRLVRLTLTFATLRDLTARAKAELPSCAAASGDPTATWPQGVAEYVKDDRFMAYKACPGRAKCFGWKHYTDRPARPVYAGGPGLFEQHVER